MAKRAPVDEKPFRPLDESVLSAVLQHKTGEKPKSVEISTMKVLEFTGEKQGEERHLAVKQVLSSGIQPLNQVKRFQLTEEESMALDRLVNNLAARLRTQIKMSHVIRALATLLLNAESQIDRRAAEHARIVRPPNGDVSAIQRFDRQISLILAHAIRDSGLPRTS